jgi:hypothetical protein
MAEDHVVVAVVEGAHEVGKGGQRFRLRGDVGELADDRGAPSRFNYDG